MFESSWIKKLFAINKYKNCSKSFWSVFVILCKELSIIGSELGISIKKLIFGI